MSTYSIEVEGRKTIINDVAKTAAFVDAAGDATVVHPTEDTVTIKADGTAINPATKQPWKGETPDYVSEAAQLLTGIQSTRKGPDMTTGPTDVREQLNLTHGSHYSVSSGTVRKIVELNRTGNAEVQIHIAIAKTGPLRLQLTGATGGAVSGEAAIDVNGKDYKTLGKDNMDAFDYPMTVNIGDVVTLYLNLKDGDNKDLLVINPQ